MAAPFMGVQLGSHSVFDKGIDRVLDNLQETAGIDTVFVYATTYHGFAKNRNPDVLAPDHGVLPPDPRSRDLTTCWFTPHEEHYRGTVLRHDAARARGEFRDRDVFAEPAGPLKKRGMKLYGRILEGLQDRILPDVEVPTLFIWGRNDPAILASGPELNSDYVSGPYTEHFLDAGHWLIQEAFPEASRLILDHLGRTW